MRSVRRILALVAVCIVPALARADPAVLARYEVRRAGQPPEQLELVRAGDRIEHRYARAGTVAVYRRVGPDEREHLALFPRLGKGVRYAEGDLRALSDQTSWPALANLLDDDARRALKPVGTPDERTGSLSRLQGTLAGKPVRVTWREDVALPASLQLGRGRAALALRLLTVQACTPERCRPTSTDGVQLLDFADLGDMTYDPFVRAFLRERGDAHAH